MSLFNAQTFNAHAFAAKFFVRSGGSDPPIPPTPPAVVAPAPGGGKGSRKRRRILLDDGRIWVPATEADFQDYIAQLIRSFEARLPPPLEPPDAPRRKRYKAAVKSLAEIPRLMVQRPLPGGFYEALANNTADVLTSRLLSEAWAAYAAELEDEEA